MVLIFDIVNPFNQFYFRNYFNAFSQNSSLSVFIKFGQKQDQRKLLILSFSLFNDLVTNLIKSNIKYTAMFLNPGSSGLRVDQDHLLDKGRGIDVSGSVSRSGHTGILAASRSAQTLENSIWQNDPVLMCYFWCKQVCVKLKFFLSSFYFLQCLTAAEAWPCWSSL